MTGENRVSFDKKQLAELENCMVMIKRDGDNIDLWYDFDVFTPRKVLRGKTECPQCDKIARLYNGGQVLEDDLFNELEKMGSDRYVKIMEERRGEDNPAKK